MYVSLQSAVRRRPWRAAGKAALLAALVFAGAVAAGAQGPKTERRARIEVRADRTAYEPGATVRLATRVTIQDHWHVNSHTPIQDWLIATELELEVPADSSEPELLYPEHSLQKFEFWDEPIAVYDGTVRILGDFTLPADAAPGTYEVEAALLYQACDDRQCEPPTTARDVVELTVGPGGVAAHADWFQAQIPPADTAGSGARGLGWMLLLAFVGGFILNAMPCVLPVLSLKLFGLVKSAGQGRAQLLIGNLVTTAGILASFWVLALAAVLAARAGAAVGWGVQFQQPAFVAFLAVVVVLFSLNMWGLFEISLPQSLARLGGSGPREGLAGHFVSGLFVTLMATPCSAPFLGTAVGFALAQPPAVIFAVFTAVGLGLALPYLVIAALPGAVRLLPKPGDWMVTVRQVMGFLLAAAAVWLFYVLAAQISPERVAYFQLALLVLALFAWLHHRSTGSGTWRKLATAGMVAAAVGSLFLATREDRGDRIAWVPFDESQAIALAAEGTPVFVDVTAAWCLTCKSIERLVIETADVRSAFERHQVVAMKADWTNRDDTITAFLARYGKSAVPFYVLYRPGREPLPFGEILTKGQLVGALDEGTGIAATSGEASGLAAGGG